MERENFYIALELSIDPPETDPEIIEAAILKKQSEWSRLRNHPLKGLQAQQFISMIPEIRRVMSDPDLREQEAAAAKEYAAKDKTDKITDIDRHINILMGKGFVSKEEIVKLTKLHGLSENEIQDRIRLKKDEKYSRVDQQLSLRMAKGYITEKEIEKLAKRHKLKPEEVKSRVYTPMVRNGKANAPLSYRQLERSIEKSIWDNLKIVDKVSLYDFLGLHESTDLETLRSAATKKKKQLASAGKRDAKITAGNTLAGHCLTIFKNEESRIAYDISMAKSKLAELDSDIDISGFNGKIRREYYEILVQKAMDFGMEKQEAERYIKDYCKRKNWTIEQPSGKKRNFVIIGAVFGIILIAASAFSLFYTSYTHKQQIQAEYTALIAKIEADKNSEDAADTLEQFMAEYEEEDGYKEIMEDARTRMEEYRAKVAEEEYAEMKRRVESFRGTQNFDKAKSGIHEYLQTNPPSLYAQKARDELAGINAMIEESTFKELSRIVIEEGTEQKIEKITGYLENFPDGKHADEVRAMLNDMSNEYYIYVKNRLQSAEERQDWQECANLAKAYIDLYDNSQADKLKKELERYNNNLRQQRIFASLRQKAGQYEDDHEKAMEVYDNYLAAYPNTRIRDKIEKELAGLRERQKKAESTKAKNRMLDMIETSGGRFIKQGDGVAKDSRTGLMWTLLDSNMYGGKSCMTFEDAQDYTENLSTGNYSDWRLPTPGELAEIYKKPRAFPVMEEKRYWTAKTYSGYSEGWYKIVDTIHVLPGTKASGVRMDSRECGVVRAVRE